MNGTVYSWDNPEIDVSTLTDGGVVVLFHDTNTKCMASVDKGVKDVNT